MPLYGTPQAGSNPIPGLNITSLEPGQNLTLLNGTEAIVSGSASISFSKAYHEAGQYPITFNVTGCVNQSVIDIQVAADDVAGEYYKIATVALDASGNGAYTDTGASPFRRVNVATLIGSDTPIVKANR